PAEEVVAALTGAASESDGGGDERQGDGDLHDQAAREVGRAAEQQQAENRGRDPDRAPGYSQSRGRERRNSEHRRAGEIAADGVARLVRRPSADDDQRGDGRRGQRQDDQSRRQPQIVRALSRTTLPQQQRDRGDGKQRSARLERNAQRRRVE